jgi:hypothetical protein
LQPIAASFKHSKRAVGIIFLLQNKKPTTHMNIILENKRFFQSLSEKVSKKVKKLWKLGVLALTTGKSESLRSSARKVSENWKTSKTKMYRLSKSPLLLGFFVSLVSGLSLVKPNSKVNIDFSDFGNDLWVLCFVVQTKNGRPVPVYFEILQIPIEKGSLNTFVIQTIQNFINLLGFKPKLVFDRGFSSPYVAQFLDRSGITFYIRLKKGKHVQTKRYGTQEACKISCKDNEVWVYGLSLRLVVSHISKDQDEPWYLLSNDFKSIKRQVIKTYYHRFEIEEFFRDAKRLFGLEHVSIKKPHSLSVVLWFVIAGTWFFLQLEMLQRQNGEVVVDHRKYFGLSVTRYYFELLQAEMFRMAWGVGCGGGSLDV